MAKLYKTTGEIVEVEPENGSDFSLEELQSFVDGYIEVAFLDKERVIVINEEGKIKNLPYNENATAEYNKVMRCRADYIAGDALICKHNQIK